MPAAAGYLSTACVNARCPFAASAIESVAICAPIESRTATGTEFTCNPVPLAAGVPGSFPGIIGIRYRKFGSVFAPCHPVANEKVAFPELALAALDEDQIRLKIAERTSPCWQEWEQPYSALGTPVRCPVRPAPSCATEPEIVASRPRFPAIMVRKRSGRELPVVVPQIIGGIHPR
jgi:hypothetical protein